MHRFVAPVLLIALAIACHKPTSKGVEPDPKLVRYLPPDVTMLGGIDVDALIASPLYKRHQGELDPRQLDMLTERTGVDPRKDLKQAVFTWDAGEPVMLARGRFDQVKRGPDLAFPKPDVLALGPAPFLKRVPLNDTQLAPAVQQRLDEVPKNDQIWIVSSQGVPLERVPVATDVRSALANVSNNIRAFSVGIGADEGAHLHAELLCDSEAGAKRVHDALRGLIGMGRLMTRDDQLDTLKLYDAVQVDQDHSLVHVHADLDAKEADAAIGMAARVRRR